MMQPRFERRQANTALSLIEQARFRAGFDFLRLRADAGEAPVELAEWWEDFSLGSDDEREALLVAVRESQRHAPRHAPRKTAAPRTAKPAAVAAALPEAEPDEGRADAAPDGAEVGDATPAGDAPARKRRRRRRKPAAGDGPAAGEA